jgi:phospholipid/cholesterol/gamma-HCH transport system substrate-binding protein
MAVDVRERAKQPGPPKVHRTLRDRLQKSFLERNTKLIGAIGVAAIVAFTVLALALQGGLLTKRYTVHAVFADAAGIETGDRVTVAGLTAGRVNGLKIENGHVVMDLGVNSGVELTRDTQANIRIETILGRRSVDLVDGSAQQPLESGDFIPMTRTQTPIDITDLNDISVRLLNKSDAGALNQLMQEVSDITAGKAEQARTVIQGLNKITTALDLRRTELGRLLDALRTVSTTLGDRDQTLVSLIDNLNVVLGNLAQRQQALATLLQTTDTASHTTADLVGRNRSVLDATLSFLHSDLDVLARHQLDLAATVDYLEKAVKGYSSVGYSAGNFPNQWANIFVQSLGPLGVDRLIGDCGAVDQFFDQYFGTKCGNSSFPSAIPKGVTVPGVTTGSTTTTTGVQVPQLVPKLDLPLPCSVEDLLRSVLGDPARCDGR